jgi:cytochrome c553
MMEPAWIRTFRVVIGLALVAGGLGASAGIALAQADIAKQKALGQHLGRECVSCHRIDGVDNGIPGIVGWTVDLFIDTMRFYRDGSRPNPAMMSVAQSLDDDQVKALAVYFATVPAAPRRAPEPTAPTPAKR